MKGLLVKDIRLLAGQRTSLIMVLFIALFMFLMQGEISFVIGYMVFLGAIFAMGTMSYDAFENGMAFLMTLPVSRKIYVLEKYVFILGSAVILGGLSALIGGVLSADVQAEGIGQIAATCLGTFATAAVMMSVMIPVQLKFGPEKSRIVMVILVAFMFVVIAALAKIIEGFHGNFILLEKAAQMSDVQIGMVVASVVIVIVAISILISVRILEKKEY